RIDASRIPPGTSLDSIIPFRDGHQMTTCDPQSPGIASPDPCFVQPPFVDGDGDVEITVLTSHASQWQLMLPTAITKVSGKLSINDNADATRRKITFSSKQAVSIGVPGSVGDPTCSGGSGGGGTVRLVGAGGSGQDTGDIPLPCRNWTMVGTATSFKG